MNPLATFMSLRLDGDSMLQPNGYGRAANGSFGDLLGGVNAMPLLNAAGAGWKMRDAAITANCNNALKYGPAKFQLVIKSAGANDMGQHQDQRALDEYELALRHYMHSTACATRLPENAAPWTQSSGWTVATNPDLYGSGSRAWTATPGAWKKVTFTGTDIVLTIYVFDNAYFAPGGSSFKIFDENNVEVASEETGDKCYNSPMFKPSGQNVAGYFAPKAFHFTGLAPNVPHSFKIVHTGTTGQQLWIDDAMIPGPIRPLVIIPIQRYFHANWKATHPTHTDALVDGFRAIDEQIATEFDNALLLDIYRNTTDEMYADDWAHLNDAGHANALANLIADTSCLSLSLPA